MTPICIPTHNRHRFLDVTLRSLSASGVPDETPLIVYDDASKDAGTQQYLYTDRKVLLDIIWPDKGWRESGLGDVRAKFKGRGIASKIEVVRLGMQQLGVVRASQAAVRQTVERYGRKHGIIIVQDDVVFTPGWYQKLLEAAKHPAENYENPVGIVAGCWINKTGKGFNSPMTLVPRGGITGQCFYATEAGLDAIWPWLTAEHGLNKGWDNKFCAYTRTGGADVYRIFPGVCQHIGIQSLVRPVWRWNRWHKRGRVDYSTPGPYPQSKYVLPFVPKVDPCCRSSE